MRKEVWLVCIITLCTFLIVTGDRGNLTCTSPPKIKGSIPPRVEGTEHAVGTSFTYSCNHGYVSRNSINHISTCIVNEMTGQAEWTVPEIECMPRSCGDPDHVNNGRRIGNLFTFPNKVVFECDEGYKLNGINERYCQAGGDWSGKLPTCELIYCSVPPDPVNGRVRYSSLEYGTELRYECNAGFKLSEHQPRFCTEDGTWSDVEPDCIEIRCENPIQPQNGRVQLSGDPKVGSIATFSCDPDKILIGASTTKCLNSGRWTFDSPKCLRPCSVPYIENGEMGQFHKRHVSRFRDVEDFQRFDYLKLVDPNETLFLRCNQYFLPAEGDRTFDENRVEVTCNDGTWSKDLHCKQIIRCEEPIPPQYGRVHLSGLLVVGSKATFSCNHGRKLFGENTAECLSTGQWTYHAPKCLSSCRVPSISNGEIGQFYSQYISSQRTEERFTKFHYMQLVDPYETLFLRCNQDFFPAEGDTIFEENRAEMTCNDGTWSRDLQCKQQTSCLKDPPKTSNGEAQISSQKHGHAIWYKCNDKTDVKVPGNVTCYFGSWIGIPPKCLISPCNTKDLNYPGLVKPSQEQFGTSETFNIICKEGFRLSTSAKDIACSGGKWNITQNPCIEVQNDIVPKRTISEDSSSIGLHQKVFSVSPSRNITNSQPTEECYCVYNGYPSLVQAKVGGRYLESGDRVRKGETVSFECSNLRILSWQNSFRIYVKVNVKCTTCQIWNWHDNPACIERQAGSPHILLNNALNILPGGAAEIEVGKSVLITCTSDFGFPQWYLRGKLLTNQDTYYQDIGNTRLHYARLHIAHSGHENRGIYVCNVTGISPLVDSRTVLDLRIKGNTCQSFITNLVVSYTNGNQVGSWATFKCPLGTTQFGDSQSICQADGTWSSPPPSCRGYPTCSILPHVPGLKVLYSNGQYVGSNASFSCTSPKVLNGNSYAVCQEDRNWSHHLPTCKENPTCSMLPRTAGLQMRYSNAINVGSNVSFKCTSPKVLNGNPYAICQDDRKWSHPLPTCEDKCSIDNLIMSMPENVVPVMSNVTSEYVEFGSAVQLQCDDEFIPEGNSVVLCGKNGSWKVGNFNCVSGCLLNINPSSHLIVQPVKEFYGFGEHILLSCPVGEKMTRDVQLIMCLGSFKWTDTIPECNVL